jgi:cytochrome c oxidase subunit 2
MAADASSAAGAPVRASWRSDRDVVWLLTLWIVLSIIGCLLVALVWGPHMPPGRASSTAASQATDITVLATIAAPVVIGILLYFGWALAFWRQKPGDETDAAPLHGNIKVQATWIVATSAIVLALAVYGTVELIAPAGAGAGQGPQPIFRNGMPPAASATSWSPNSNNILQVQVIGQQWAWTFRYPQFGGFETTQLALPDNQPVQFNVTSLDVIHSFWAYTLGVKADANPGVNNVAYTTPNTLGDFQVRCAELCGIWHGAMYDTGEVLSDANFMAWTKSESVKLAGVTKMLPPYALTYDPTTIAILGKVNTALGLTGAGGGFYNPADPEQP